MEDTMKTRMAVLALAMLATLAGAVEIKQPGIIRDRAFDGQVVVGRVVGVTLENCTFTGGPTTVGDGGAHLIVASYASDVWIIGCTFDGSAYRAIHSRGRDVHVIGCTILGTCANQPDSDRSFYSDGIKIVGAGKTEIRGNTIADVGGMGILLTGETALGDYYNIEGNTLARCGQAGISAYKTRGEGWGRIRGNDVSTCDRLAGTPGALGNSACGIHLNDGAQSGVDPAKPFIPWNVERNTVYACAAPASPKNEDSGGIAVDYNANRATVMENVIYGNWGKGIYVYNADSCWVYGNLVYRNDSGITVSSGGGAETAANNRVEGNMFWQNGNGDAHGPDYNCEVLFGLRGAAIITGNALMPAAGGYSYYWFGDKATVRDNAIVGGNDGYYSTNGHMTRGEWRKAGFDLPPEPPALPEREYELRATLRVRGEGCIVAPAELIPK
jgi:parallel beta-helix repeat protein